MCECYKNARLRLRYIQRCFSALFVFGSLFVSVNPAQYVAIMQAQLDKLRRINFSSRSEKIFRRIAQMEADLNRLQKESDTLTGRVDDPMVQRPLRQPHTRKPFPESLPGDEKRLLSAKPCCPDSGGSLSYQGEDTDEQLELMRSAFWVIRLNFPYVGNTALGQMAAIMIGGATGCIIRCFFGMKLNSFFPSLPSGTLVVNLLGAFIIGGAMAYFIRHPHVDPAWKLLIVTGLCGGADYLFNIFCRGFHLIAGRKLHVGFHLRTGARDGIAADDRGGFLSDNVSYMILRHQEKLTSWHKQAHN